MAKIVQPRFPKFDRRLLGVWKSDKRRTFADWNWRKRLSPLKKKRFKSLFGKLEVTYTVGEVISRLRHRGWEQSRRYVITATDETSVAIVQFGKLEFKNRRKYSPEGLKMVEELFPPKPKIEHVHFDKQHYWVSLGDGRNREFFRKIRNGK